MSTPYEFDLALRWSDQDALGHVNNATVVTLAEEGRVRFHLQLPGGRTAEGGAGDDMNLRRVVARQEIDYHAETHYGTATTMQVGVLRIGNSSYTLRQRAVQEGRPTFTVDTVMVNLEEGSSRPLTDQERAGLQEWMWPEDPQTGDDDAA